MRYQYRTHRSDRQRRTDRRAVSEVIGAILLFGLVVMLLVLIQVNAVPAANKQVEFEHNQRVSQDLQSLQGDLYQVGTTGDPASAAVETGIIYPNRFFLLNPSPAIGTLQTSDPMALTIGNARADGNPGDYWNGSEVTFLTRSIIYTPDYKELRNAGTTHWEHSMLFTRYDNANIYFDDPTAFIDGRQIRLTLVDGAFSSRGLSTSVALTPVSTGSRTLSVDRVGAPITITLETSLTETEWTDALSEQAYASVLGFEDGTVTVALDPQQRYDLRISKVRVGSETSERPGARYLTDIAGNGTNVPEGSSHRLVVEVRDEFNNPVSNVEVTATILNGDGSIQPFGDTRSDSDGRVTFRYDAEPDVDDPQDVRIETAIGPTANPTDPSQRATFRVRVLDSDGSGDADRDEPEDINPFGPDTIQLEDAVIVEEDRGQPFDDVDVIQVRFSNTYDVEDVDITRARLVMYVPRNQQGNGLARTPPMKAILYDDGASVTTGYDLFRGGDYATVNGSLDTLTGNGGNQTYTFELIDDAGDNYQPVAGEMFTLTLEFDTDDRITYLITPRNPA